VVAELKTKPPEPELAGRLSFCVDAVGKPIRDGRDNPTTGPLICRDSDGAEVQWALGGFGRPWELPCTNVVLEQARTQPLTGEQIQQHSEQAEWKFILAQGHPTKA
jgi:hypothetical protein